MGYHSQSRYSDLRSFPCIHAFSLSPSVFSHDATKFAAECRECKRTSAVSGSVPEQEIISETVNYELPISRMTYLTCEECDKDRDGCRKYLCNNCAPIYGVSIYIYIFVR